MIFNIVSVVDWKVVTAAKRRKLDTNNVQENAKQVTHIGNQFHVEMTNICCKLYYSKQGTYRITEVFTNGTVQFQLGQVK